METGACVSVRNRKVSTSSTSVEGRAPIVQLPVVAVAKGVLVQEDPIAQPPPDEPTASDATCIPAGSNRRIEDVRYVLSRSAAVMYIRSPTEAVNVYGSA